MTGQKETSFIENILIGIIAKDDFYAIFYKKKY